MNLVPSIISSPNIQEQVINNINPYQERSRPSAHRVLCKTSSTLKINTRIKYAINAVKIFINIDIFVHEREIMLIFLLKLIQTAVRSLNKTIFL